MLLTSVCCIIDGKNIPIKSGKHAMQQDAEMQYHAYTWLLLGFRGMDW
jgi:hypothetical protein